MAERELIEAFTKKLVDDGLLVEAGWVGFELAVIPPNAGQVQRDEMRKAFFGGAHHLFASLMTIMGDSDEPSPDEERRMLQVSQELTKFMKSMKHAAVS